jgi:hypothetical protein
MSVLFLESGLTHWRTAMNMRIDDKLDLTSELRILTDDEIAAVNGGTMNPGGFLCGIGMIATVPMLIYGGLRFLAQAWHDLWN